MWQMQRLVLDLSKWEIDQGWVSFMIRSKLQKAIGQIDVSDNNYHENMNTLRYESGPSHLTACK